MIRIATGLAPWSGAARQHKAGAQPLLAAARVCAALATILALTALRAGAAEPWRGIPQGREPSLIAMLGGGQTLPGECRFAGGLNAAFVTAQYTCRDGNLTLELRDPEDAPAEALRTRYFAITVLDGSPPEGFLDALVVLVRAGEPELFDASAALSPAVRTTLSGAAAIIALAVAAQLLVQRRWPAPRPRTAERLRGTALALTLALVAAYLVSHLALLQRLPVFNDEATHIQWAGGAFGAYFASALAVGKWLPVQIMAAFLALPVEPLLAARAASVAMGLVILLGCVLINRELFSWRAGIVAGALYAALPFTVLYDRMALADVYVSAFAATSIWFALRLRHAAGPGPGVGLVVCLCGAILSKPTGGVFGLVPLLVAILLVQRSERARYLVRSLPAMLGGASLLAFLLARGYGTQLVAAQSDLDRSDAVARLLSNLTRAGEWFDPLFTSAIAVALGAAVVLTVIRVWRRAGEEVFLFALLGLAFLPYMLVSEVWYPRYVLFTAVPVALLAGRTVSAAGAALGAAVSRVRGGVDIIDDVLTAALTALLLLPIVPASVAVVRDPAGAALPDVDRRQYVSGWSAGYGLPELVVFLRAQAQTAPVNVVAFNDQGPPNEGIDVYLGSDANLRRHLVDKNLETAATQISNLARRRRTLLVLNPHDGSPDATPPTYLGNVERIWTYVRPGGESRLEVWEVRARAPGA